MSSDLARPACWINASGVDSGPAFRAVDPHWRSRSTRPSDRAMPRCSNAVRLLSARRTFAGHSSDPDSPPRAMPKGLRTVDHAPRPLEISERHVWLCPGRHHRELQRAARLRPQQMLIDDLPDSYPWCFGFELRQQLSGTGCRVRPPSAKPSGRISHDDPENVLCEIGTARNLGQSNMQFSDSRYALSITITMSFPAPILRMKLRMESRYSISFLSRITITPRAVNLS